MLSYKLLSAFRIYYFSLREMSQLKRDMKKSSQEPMTVEEMFRKTNSNLNTSLIASENENESFIEVFKSYAKEKKPVSLSQCSKKQPEDIDHDLDELFSDFKIRKNCELEKKLEIEPFSKPMSSKSTGTREVKQLSDCCQDYVQFCPICYRKNYSEQSTFISHLKSCAARNNITTEQLMKAMDLQQKQANERVALGLPLMVKEKSKKPSLRKTKMDSNLELGLALSTSLRDSEIMDKIQEKEILLEAGIEPEILSQYKNLNDFGFASFKPMDTAVSKGSSRSKKLQNTKLFTRSKEERERIITEKVAILLIDCDSQTSSTEEDKFKPLELKSKFLKNLRDYNITLWKKSYQLDEYVTASYYVGKLSNFISQCNEDIAAKLKHLSQIPGRSPSPNKQLPLPKSLASKKTCSADHLSTNVPTECPLDSKLSQDWACMLNQKVLSDVIIYTKTEMPIHAHKLVFYTRCRSILQDLIKETENGKTTEILMWMEYCFEVVMVFLKYIYTGACNLKDFEDSHKKEFRDLCNRYGFKNLIELVDKSEPELFEKEQSSQDEINFSEFNKTSHSSPISSRQQSPSASFDFNCETGETNLKLLQIAFQTQSPDGTKSQEMFENEEVEKETKLNSSFNNSKELIEDILSNLCSPVGASKTPEINLVTSSPEILPADSPESVIDRSPLTQLTDLTRESDSVGKNKDKRKSSPLENQNRKKSRSDTPKSSQTPKKRRTPRKTPSQVLLVGGDTEARDEELKPDKVVEFDPEKNNTPYVSPIWDGFDDFNMDFNNGFSPLLDRIETPAKELTEVPDSDANTGPFFESFSIDENFLNKLENKCKVELPSSTPESVKKLQCRSKSENCITPTTSRQVFDVTPMADYSNMKADDLKKELDKYGLKPGLSRNKAKMMLRYIYEQLHPFEDEAEEAVVQNHGSVEKSSNHNTNSYASSNSDASGISLLEESYFNDNVDILTQDPSSNSKTKVDIDTGIRTLLSQDELFHQKILSYEPIWLESLKATLKENGVKCSMNELMNYLDEKCITFRSQQTHRKRKKKSTSTATKQISKLKNQERRCSQ